MENNKIVPLTLGGLIFILLGGIFAFIFMNDGSNVFIWPIIAILGILVLVIIIGVFIIKKKRSVESQTNQPHYRFESLNIDESKQQTCYWCGFPFEKLGEFCPDCGKRILRCVVCKLPISFGDEIGKCSLCETKGHFNHLFEWVKTKGKCPQCLQHLPTQAIIEAYDLK